MSRIKEYLARRIVFSLAVLLGVLTLVFFFTRVVPSDPAALYAGAHPTPEEVERIRHMLGLDKPLYIQYIIYLEQFFTGRWGISYRTHHPILYDIAHAVTASLELVLAAFIIGVAAGILMGVLSALYANRHVDHFFRILAVIGASVPAFVLGLILQLVFAYWLNVLPVAGRISFIYTIQGFHPITGFYTIDALLEGRLDVFIDVVKHLILPALVLAAYPAAVTARMTRAVMIEVMEEQYVTAARAWGVDEKIILLKYVLRNSIAPSITVLAMSFAYTLVNDFLVEVIFAWPGLGYYAAKAILSMDYPAVIASCVVGAIFYLVANTIADITHALLDPRVALR